MDLVQSLEENLQIKANVLTVEMPKGEVLKTWSDCTKSRKKLCFQPQIDLSDGIAKFSDWYLQEYQPHVKNMNQFAITSFFCDYHNIDAIIALWTFHSI